MLSWMNIASSLILLFLILARTSAAQESKILKDWDFDETAGWSYGNEIIDPHVGDSILEFTSAGSDPILIGPQYEPLSANNRQRLEIRLKADSSGTWQFFYAETNEGRFGGCTTKKR